MKVDFETCIEIANEYGDAFYLFKEKQFEKNYRDLLTSFKEFYPNISIAYSYKTNYVPYIGRLINAYGGFAEVTSELEYEIALKNGVKASQIILNGPIHKEAFIAKVLKTGAIWNIDGFRQLNILSKICKAHPDMRFKVGLRLNVSDQEAFISRFGFDTKNKDAAKAVSMINEIDNCDLVGLHSHYWLPKRKPEAFANRLKEMISFSKAFSLTNNLEYLNIGGSFYGPLSPELAEQLENPTPSFQEYGSTIASLMRDAFPEGGVKLFLEPGVSLVGNSIDYFARVYDIKEVKGKNYAIVEGSVHNVKPSLHRFNLKSEAIAKKKASKKKYQVVGYTCLEYDYLRKDLDAGLEIGDFIRIHDVGAYTITIKAPFIKGAPPIITFKEGKTKCLRRAETFEDLFTAYNFDA